MKAFDRFGVLSVMGGARDPQLHSIKPSSAAAQIGAAETFNPNDGVAFASAGVHRNRALFPGVAQFPSQKAAPFLGARGPGVGPVRLPGAPAYGQRSSFLNLGQTSFGLGQASFGLGQASFGLGQAIKPPVTCEKTPDGGAVCSDGTFHAPSCGDPQLIANAASTGSTNADTKSSLFVPLAAGTGVLGLLAYFFLR